MLWRLALENGREIELDEGEIVLGRSSECQVQLRGDLSVSRRHARLIVLTDRVIVEDLGSSNGTLVNNLPVGQPTPLDTGDVLYLGDTRLKVRRGKPTTAVLVPGTRRLQKHIRAVLAAGSVAAFFLVGATRLQHAAHSQRAAGSEELARAYQPLPKPAPARVPLAALGALTFERHCAECHVRKGEGASGPRLAQTSHPHEIEEIRRTIIQGVRPLMPPFKGVLSAEQVEAVATYTRKLMGNRKSHHH